MDLNTQRRCLTMLAGGLFAGAVAAGVWSLSGIEELQPLSSVASADDNAIGPNSSNNESRNETIPLLELRRPLIDTPIAPAPEPPAAAPVPPPPRSNLELTLVGTIIDARQRFAIVVDPSGKFDVKGVGESLELEPAGVRIQSIDSEQITLAYRGSESTVKLDRFKKAGKPARNPGGPNNRSGAGRRIRP